MKKNIKYFSILIVAFVITNCTSNFEDINTNEYGVSDTELEQDFNNIKALFPALFNNIYQINPEIEWGYQIQTNLQGDLWSGYMATPTPFVGNSNNSHYNLINGWNGYAWDLYYDKVMSNAYKLKLRTKEKYPLFYAISLILKASATHKMTDYYGPIIYSQFESNTETKSYDSVEQVYNALFQELDTAVNLLENTTVPLDNSFLSKIDLSNYGGNYEKWIRYANSLRLRIAMRIVKINSAKAKLEAEKAINHPLGVISSNEENFVIKIPTGTHPLNTISNSWDDIRMGADMESILVGYNDPRIATYFESSEAFPNTYRGIHTGIEIVSKTDRTGMSKIGKIVNRNEIVLLNAAEVKFLVAEAALRNWNTNGYTAQAAYENGINLSFAQHSASNAFTYINNSTSLPQNFTDPVNSLNNETSVNNVTIKWNENDSSEIKLQKIITQKWIAMFPDGQEAWAEWRRTGYPKLFQIKKNDSGGIIPSSLGVRRINFPLSEYSTNPTGVATGVSLLNGADNGATRLWWDVNAPNF